MRICSKCSLFYVFVFNIYFNTSSFTCTRHDQSSITVGNHRVCLRRVTTRWRYFSFSAGLQALTGSARCMIPVRFWRWSFWLELWTGLPQLPIYTKGMYPQDCNRYGNWSGQCQRFLRGRWAGVRVSQRENRVPRKEPLRSARTWEPCPSALSAF